MDLRKYWSGIIRNANSPEEFVDIFGEIFDAYMDEVEKNKQIMDGLEEYLTNHRDENYIREIYNFHKSKRW